MNQEIAVVIEHLQGQIAEISYIMLAAGRALADETGGKVIALLLAHDHQNLASDMAADEVLHMDHPAFGDFTSDAYLQALTSHIQATQPRVVLLGHTTIGMDVAGGLSARMGLPLVSQCQNLMAKDGEIIFRSQICGGKIMAEGTLQEPTALVTMVPGAHKPQAGQSEHPPPVRSIETPDLKEPRIRLVHYIESEIGDVDITKEPILISVGRGLQNHDDLEIVEELAEALGGALCASRPIVDLGWLGTARLVGKSGKTVKPRLYLALGISGAPEHVQAITDSEIIVAVNTDPDAPIFDLADYGAEVDMLDLISALTARLQVVQVA